ncbi:hypothetical protein L596_027147 [Steinernema carpocapsae]|uniref:Uncharacterized protein n=1 Tax=Steinernema carpocapsae TaxID=34508 RepID=A0A4U5M3L3_STECR|nr:hypothetical protein L596_027147 [Steinernema carpocapsae]
MTTFSSPQLAQQVLDHLSRRNKKRLGAKELFFLLGIDFLSPFFTGDDRYVDLLSILLANTDHLSMRLLRCAKELLSAAARRNYAKVNRFEYFHVVVSLSVMLQNDRGQNYTLWTDAGYAKVERRFLDLLEECRRVTKINLDANLPIFSCLTSLLSHFLRHGEPRGLTLPEYLNTLTGMLWTRKPKLLASRKPDEPQKYIRSAYFWKVNRKPQPENRLWKLITKNGFDRKTRTSFYQICSICCRDF